MTHISDYDLERYHLGMVKDEAELALLEEHLLWCPTCVKRAEENLLTTWMRSGRESPLETLISRWLCVPLAH